MVICLIIGCRKDVAFPPDGTEIPEAPASPVVFDPVAAPYPTLSDYGFFLAPMRDLEPVQGVLPYDVVTPLFSDHASKERFIWMPHGVSASYAGADEVLEFPESTVLIKNFYYDGVQPGGGRRIIETRLMFLRNGIWEFANYVWNAAQTEATLDMNGSFTPVTFLGQDGIQHEIQYRIPSAAECKTCHKTHGDPVPIGPKPRNLRMDLSYPAGTMDQLAKWKEVGYLDPATPEGIVPVARWNDATADLQQRVRAYLDMNCAHCHTDGGHCDYRPMRFAYEDTVDDEAIGICVTPHEQLQPHHTRIVEKGNIERSVLHYRLNSTHEAERMPLLGRTVVHDEALAMIEQWILSLGPPCD